MGLHARGGVPGRTGVGGLPPRARRALLPAGDGTAEEVGAGAGPVEPVPARAVRPVRPGVRARSGDLRLVAGDRAGGDQLPGAGHREHGSAAHVRHGGAETAVAAAADGRGDPVGLRDDRAGRGVLRRDQHRDLDHARRRRVRDQRPQVVDQRRGRRALRGLHRDGPVRAGRRTIPAPVHDPGAAGHPGRDDRAAPAHLRLPGPARAFGDRLRRGPGAGVQPAGRRGRRLRHRPGPAGSRADPPRHARDRDGRAGAGADGGPGAEPDRVRDQAVGSGRGPRADRPVAHGDRPGAAVRLQDGLDHRPGGRQGGPVRDRRDQGGGTGRGHQGDRPGHRGPRGRGSQRRHSAGVLLRLGPRRCASSTARTPCTAARSPATNCAASGRTRADWRYVRG